MKRKRKEVPRKRDAGRPEEETRKRGEIVSCRGKQANTNAPARAHTLGSTTITLMRATSDDDDKEDGDDEDDGDGCDDGRDEKGMRRETVSGKRSSIKTNERPKPKPCGDSRTRPE